MEGALTVAILIAAAAGSVGFVGNNVYTSRHGFDQPWLRALRNLGIAAIWPLVIARALL